mgnify:FL=1
MYKRQDESIKGPYWSTTFEGSRSATGASATWLSSQALSLSPGGHGKVLESTIEAKREFEKILEKSLSEVLIIKPTDTNISCFSFVKEGEQLSASNKRVEAIFKFFANESDFSVSRTVLTMEGYSALINKSLVKRKVQVDVNQMVLIRVVLMNPFYMEDGYDYLNTSVGRIKSCLENLNI